MMTHTQIQKMLLETVTMMYIVMPCVAIKISTSEAFPRGLQNIPILSISGRTTSCS